MVALLTFGFWKFWLSPAVIYDGPGIKQKREITRFAAAVIVTVGFSILRSKYFDIYSSILEGTRGAAVNM